MIDFEDAFITQNRLKSASQIIVEDQEVINGQYKVISRSADGRPGTIFIFWMDGQMIKIIFFKLLLKGCDTQSTSNVKQNGMEELEVGFRAVLVE